MKAKFVLTTERHTFDSARDAIDAVSGYESSILIDVSYDILPMSDDTWVANVYSIFPREHLGFLAPTLASQFAEESA